MRILPILFLLYIIFPAITGSDCPFLASADELLTGQSVTGLNRPSFDTDTPHCGVTLHKPFQEFLHSFVPPKQPTNQRSMRKTPYSIRPLSFRYSLSFLPNIYVSTTEHARVVHTHNPFFPLRI